MAEVARNPLALVELAGELTAGELSGAVPLSWPLRFGGGWRICTWPGCWALAVDTQTLLLVAAADPSGDPALVAKAAGQLGIDAETGEAAGTDRLVAWEPRVRFPAPADPVGGLLRGPVRGAAPRACGAGPGHRPRRRPGPAGLAPGSGRGRAG